MRTTKSILLLDISPNDVSNIIMDNELKFIYSNNEEFFYMYARSDELNAKKDIIKGIDCIVCINYNSIPKDIFNYTRAGEELEVFEIHTQDIVLTCNPPIPKTIYNFFSIPKEAIEYHKTTLECINGGSTIVRN